MVCFLCLQGRKIVIQLIYLDFNIMYSRELVSNCSVYLMLVKWFLKSAFEAYYSG